MSTATATKGTKEERSTASAKLLGLCASCDHAGGCMHQSRSEGGVWHCEDYEAGEPGRAIPLREASAPTPQADSLGLVGLCATCDERHDCGHALRTGGVWHCEQFV